MKTIVIGNCASVSYAEAIKEIFPDWEIRRVDIGDGLRWLEDGSKPQFTQYLRTCDLYVGHPMDGWPSLAEALNPGADRVLIPSLTFRGLHPDIAMLPGLESPMGHSQTSLIAVAAKALNLGVAETVELYNDVAYEALGYFAAYTEEKNRLLRQFNAVGIDLTFDIPNWEAKGDYFYLPIHARAYVLIDIVRRALVGRYIDERVHSQSARLSGTLPDHLQPMPAWPVYPGIAARIGFAGSLVWRRLNGNQDLSLAEYVEATFRSLEAMDGNWRQISFVERAASALRPVAATARIA